jgi:hypothetical protein
MPVDSLKVAISGRSHEVLGAAGPPLAPVCAVAAAPAHSSGRALHQRCGALEKLRNRRAVAQLPACTLPRLSERRVSWAAGVGGAPGRAWPGRAASARGYPAFLGLQS